MTVFLVSVLVLALFGLAVLHVLQSRDWREERALLLQAVMAKSGTEFRAILNPADGPAVPQRWTDELEGYDAPVGL